MPQISQISAPLAGGKGVGTQTGGTQTAPNEPFEVNGATPVPNVSTVAQKGIGAASLSGEGTATMHGLSVPVAKDPSMAVETMADMLGADLMESVKQSGYTQLEGDLQDLTKSLYLKPSELMREILTQEKDNTVFSGNTLFDCLRSLVQTGDDDTKELVANLLKGINYALNKQDIIKAVTANIKFLSEYFGENTTVAKNLDTLYQKWEQVDLSQDPDAKRAFELLKNETTSLLRTVSESLQNDQRTQTLIPLTIHNLSRYNTNKYMLKEAFSQLLAQVPSNAMRDRLIDSFGQFLRELQENESISSTNNTTFNKINQEDLQIFSENGEKITLEQFLARKLSDESYLSRLPLGAKNADAPVRAMLLGKTDGLGAIKSVLSLLFPVDENDRDLNVANAQKTLENQISNAGSLRDLVNMLNSVLAQMPESSERQAICDSLAEIIAQMAQSHELPTDKPATPYNSDQKQISETMKSLTGFIERNVNHPAIKSVDNFNASNLLQSLLNAPGVFTPLSHYIIPLQIENTKAFGELWVDSEGKNSSKGDGTRQQHVFLTFDVEAIGRFEVNVYLDGKDLNVSMLHPASYIEKSEKLTEKITKIAAGLGLNTENFKTGILTQPRTLAEVFPKILENRRGFDVKA